MALRLPRILRITPITLVALAILTLAATSATGATSKTSDVLRLDDFPSGWRAGKGTPPGVGNKTPACKALREETGKTVSSARTKTFTDSDPRASDFDVIVASVARYPSARVARDEVAAFVGRHRLQCLIDGTNRGFESDNKDSKATTTVHELVLPNTATRVRAVEAISHVSGFDTFELRQQIIFIRNGERVVTLHVNSDQDANYSEIRDHLVARIEQRLADGAAVRT